MLSHGEIVASGSPTSIGGRDSSTVTIRFILPSQVAASDIPITVTSVHDGVVQIVTEDELRVLHTLTGWALEHGHALMGLAVVRVTLEDIYLRLTRESLTDDEVYQR